MVVVVDGELEEKRRGKKIKTIRRVAVLRSGGFAGGQRLLLKMAHWKQQKNSHLDGSSRSFKLLAAGLGGSLSLPTVHTCSTLPCR